MKKSLLAVAAMGAFASVAQAQSSVTVYGILDVGFQGRTKTVNNIKTNSTQFNGDGAESTSRLGFKGTEDLGGGVKAFFVTEFQLYPTDRALSGDTNGGLFNRQTNVGLSKTGLGQFAVGTQYTPLHLAVGRNDPGKQNNMVGDVIYTPNAATGNDTTSTSYTVRQNNALTAQTDRMAGFVVSGMYTNKNSSSNNSSNDNNQGYGIGINYVWNKLNVDLNAQSFKNETAVRGVNTPATLASATNLKDDQQYAGASYDFGILTAYAQYVNRKASAAYNSNLYAKRSAQSIGVRSFITPKVAAWASLGNGSFKTFGTSSPTSNFNGFQLGSDYILSKRTNLYAIYGKTQTSSNSLNASANHTSYGLGVRHTF
jgi:predicted porin